MKKSTFQKIGKSGEFLRPYYAGLGFEKLRSMKKKSLKIAEREKEVIACNYSSMRITRGFYNKSQVK